MHSVRTSILTLVLAVVPAACIFDPQQPASFRCSTEQPACPAGLSCVNNRCVAPGADARSDARPPDRGRGDSRPDSARGDAPRTDAPRIDAKRPDGPRPDVAKPVCGNGKIEAGEACDGSTFPTGKDSCKEYKRNGGILKCTNCLIDLTQCCKALIPPLVSPLVSRIVSVDGDDATATPLCTPYRTITKAILGLTAATSVWVTSGTYDAAGGEVFPIFLPQQLQLLGDEATKGKGGAGKPTLIAGQGVLASPPGGFATVVASGLGKLAGFQIDGSTSTDGYCVYVPGLKFTVADNSFASGYGGVRADSSGTGLCPQIVNNQFDTKTYGVRAECPSTLIEGNTFNGTWSGVTNWNADANIVNNVFASCGTHGVQIAGGNPTLSGNVFNASATYAVAAITCDNTSTAAPLSLPKIRASTFQTMVGTAVRILPNSVPDLGTAIEPGGNTFAAARLRLQAIATTVSAIGNTWAPPTPNTPSCEPPGVSGQIFVSGTGSQVLWGSLPLQKCPP
jgi:hypothetical protein